MYKLKIIKFKFICLYYIDSLNLIDKLFNLEELQLINLNINNISNLLKLENLKKINVLENNISKQYFKIIFWDNT